MTKKRSTLRTQVNDRRLLAFLSYQVGFAGTQFQGMATSFWRTAGLGDHPPGYVDSLFGCLVAAADTLTQLAGDLNSDQRMGFVDMAKRAHADFIKGWGGERHRQLIALRDGGEPEYQEPSDMMVGSPFRSSEWESLDFALARFIGSLPAEAKNWALLGRMIAQVFDPLDGGTHGLTVIPAIESQLVAMDVQSHLQGIGWGPELWSTAKVRELHGQIWKLLTQGEQAIFAPVSGETCRGPNITESHRATPVTSKEVQAIALLAANPGWTDAQIARHVPCARTSLYRMKKFRELREVLEQNRHEHPRGYIVQNEDGRTDVEAEA